MKITVWNENVHEKKDEKVRQIHPNGIHGTVADIVREIPDAQVRTVTLDDPEAGLPQEVLDDTDVLIWWAHHAHRDVPDEVGERVKQRVLDGMGFIALHSSHKSKPFMGLMGTTCDLRWEHDTYQRVFCTNPTHPIAEGIPMHFELGLEECYAEYFDVPAPDDVIFTSWFDIGEVFRSGCTWKRGYGKVFFFQPGHETNESYFHPHIRRIIQNACKWAMPGCKREVSGSPRIGQTLESLRRKNG